MKKITYRYSIIFAAILSLLVIAGCTNNDNMENTNDNVDTTTNTDMTDANDDSTDMNMDDDSLAIGRFFASSNTMNTIGVFDETENNSVSYMSFTANGEDSDGLYYDTSSDLLYQTNRSENNVVAYTNTTDTNLDSNAIETSFMSTSNFSNGRGLTMLDDKLIVAQDGNDENENQNSLAVYEVNGDEIEFENAYNTDFNLWGIEANDDILFAIIDNSNTLAIFNEFDDLEEDLAVQDSTVTVENLVRTHGLTYYPENDMMILTDIWSAESDSDGWIIVVNNFMDAIEDEVISADEQIVISGPNSLLWNPVDVAYSPETNIIMVAERANAWGQILGFMMPTQNGDTAPDYQYDFDGASAIYFTEL